LFFSNFFLSLYYKYCNASAIILGRCYFFLSPYVTKQAVKTCKEVIMNEIQYVTKDTLEHMKQELQHLKGVERPAASRAIAEAREKGDLKENAEYDAAKDAQGHLEAKIAALEGVLSNARVLDESNIDTSKVSILTKVTLTNLGTKKKVTYQVVGEQEADLKLGKISVTSPIGKGILGKAVGETAEVQAPVGTLKFRIEGISA
jgi:transcription elongation factor GreA